MDARRGTSTLLAANALFYGASYVVHFLVGRWLGQEAYGTYGVVLGVAGVLTFVVSSGFPQSAAKHIAEEPSRARAVLRAAGLLQAAAGLALVAAYWLAAPLLAAFARDAALVGLFRLSALAVLGYVAYSLAEAGLAGLGRFPAVAAAIGGFGLVKLVAVTGALALGFALPGAVLANGAAALAAALLAFALLRRVPAGGGAFPLRRIALFGLPMLGLNLALLVLSNVDVLFVKRAVVDAEVGGFVAASTLARIPYALLGAIVLVALPALSRAAATDPAAVRRTLSDAMRLLLYVLLPACALAPFLAAPALRLAYGDAYAGASTTLAVLVVAAALLTASHVLLLALASTGSVGRALALAAALVPAHLVLLEALTLRFGGLGAAYADVATFGALAAVAFALVAARHGAPLGPRALRNVAVGLVPAVLVAWLGSSAPLPLLAEPLVFAAAFAAFAATLHALGEIDLGRWRELLPAKPGAPPPPWEP